MVGIKTMMEQEELPGNGTLVLWRPSLQQMPTLAHVLVRFQTPRRAQQFPFCLGQQFLRRQFSSGISFSRFAASAFIPPY
jgi:hypothetical protein